MGSNSDWPKLESAEKVFQEFGIDLEVTVASAHRTPELVKGIFSFSLTSCILRFSSISTLSELSRAAIATCSIISFLS